jgi:hypothetical protein
LLSRSDPTLNRETPETFPWPFASATLWSCYKSARETGILRRRARTLAVVHNLYRAVADPLRRTLKHLQQRLTYADVEATPVFLLGAQRSGTNMVIETAERCLAIRVYNEDRPEAFDRFRLRPLDVIDRLIQDCPAPLVLFKPLCDSHRADELLRRFPRAKGIWMFRNYEDVVNSAVRLWGDDLNGLMKRIAAGRFREAGYLGERRKPAGIARIRELFREDLSPADGAALFWYLRNGLFFTLGLDTVSRVLLVRYEELARHPEVALQRVYRFLGAPFASRLTTNVSTQSIGRYPPPRLDGAIRARCEEMLAQLIEHSEMQARECGRISRAGDRVPSRKRPAPGPASVASPR